MPALLYREGQAPGPLPGLPAARRCCWPEGGRSDNPRSKLPMTGLLLLLICAWVANAAWAEPRFPPLSGRIVDEANLLSGEDRRQLQAELKALEDKSTDQLVIYTTHSLQG